RLAIPPRTGALELTLTLKPVVKDDTTSQRVAVSVNDVLLDTLVYSEGPARAMTVAIPAEIVHLGTGFLEVKLDLPDAISFEAGGRGSNTQKRAILLTALRLAPPVKEEEPAVILPPAYQESVGPY
ncbi:MAG: hypothetical protein JWN11_1931, partial [Hyphomicrobiales bacterium]|nr:hypothetical protein [Hyphomicrobiales bacterium]